MKRSLRSSLWRVPLDQEVDEELEFHLQMRTRELVDRGFDPEAAREIALRRMGNLNALKRRCLDLGRKREREMRLTLWLEELEDDVKFAIRQLRSAPGFAFVAAITLALGIGANSAIFALVDATLLRPLPFADTDRVVMLWERSATSPRGTVSPLNLLDWSERSRTFEAMAGFAPNVGGMVMSGADGTAETVPRQWVTARFFDVLGIEAMVGRVFVPSDDRPGSRVIVLSEGFWRTRFNGDPTIVGRDLRLDGALYTVAGVVPKEFQLAGGTSIWALTTFPRRPQLRSVYGLNAVGRLKPGVTLDAASADLTAVAEGLAREYPATNKGRGVAIEPLYVAVIGRDLRLTSILFLGVVGLVLLICCANVANLLLARATVRTRELAIRSALGAGRKRVIRQLVTESLVLSAIGGLLGVGVGAAVLNIAPSIIPAGLLPAAVTLTFDTRIVAFCAAMALFVGLLFGLAPAWQATDFSAAQALAVGTRSATGRAGRTRGLLVAGEVATAVVLLFGAGLLLRTLMAVENVDPGYDADSALTMIVDPLGSKYPTPAALTQFYDAVEQEIRAVPGVRDVAWASTVPMGQLSYGGQSLFEIAGDPPLEANRRPTADYLIVSPAYFRTLGVPLVRGRAFTDRDTQQATPVCIVSEAFVRLHAQGRSPIGLRLAFRPADMPGAQPVVREIVGIVRQVKNRPDDVDDRVQIYVPMVQDLLGDMFLVVRPAAGRADTLAASVRAAIGRVDKEQLVSVRNMMTLEDVASEATARHRFRAVLVATFAGLALLLAMVGVFGILAYSVQQQMRDFGVRRALGATTHDVLRLVASSALRVVASGAAIGLVLAALLGRLLTTMLFGVQPLDPLTFALVVIVVIVTAAMSIAAPAWRATRIDPASALRSE